MKGIVAIEIGEQEIKSLPTVDGVFDARDLIAEKVAPARVLQVLRYHRELARRSICVEVEIETEPAPSNLDKAAKMIREITVSAVSGTPIGDAMEEMELQAFKGMIISAEKVKWPS